jgi:uncharacterized membrane protein YkvI
VGRPRGDRARHRAVQRGCALTFLFAQATRSLDYQSFFKALLGTGWVAWEVTYILFVILILAVYGAAAGEIGVALFGLPAVVGTLALMAGIVLAVMYGNKSVERLFEYGFVPALRGLRAVLRRSRFSSFGDRIAGLSPRRRRRWLGAQSARHTSATTSSARSSCCRWCGT